MDRNWCSCTRTGHVDRRSLAIASLQDLEGHHDSSRTLSPESVDEDAGRRPCRCLFNVRRRKTRSFRESLLSRLFRESLSPMAIPVVRNFEESSRFFGAVTKAFRACGHAYHRQFLIH